MSDWCTAWTQVSDLDCSASPSAAAALVFATDVLFELSGRQYTGSCVHTVRPTVQQRCAGRWGLDYSPEYWRQLPGNYAWSDPYYAVDLGLFPIRAVSQVRIDGSVLSTGSYRVDQQRYLVRTDGQPWPNAQERMKANTEVNTWEVTLTAGADPPAGGVIAVKELACELAAAVDGSDTCRLPQRVTQVTRQGVSFVMTDLMEFLAKGHTGLYNVDLFLISVNPGGNRDRPFGLLPYDVPGSYDV